MTGIERLREHGDKYQERLEGLANDMRAEVYAIADQIERETIPRKPGDGDVGPKTLHAVALSLLYDWEREAVERERDRRLGIADDVSMSAYDLLPQEERDAIAWVREHGGLDAVKELLDWVVGHCSTKQQLDFDFWLSGRVMHELGFDEDMADRDEVERRLRARLMPDSWERLEEDAGKEACEYFAHMPCGCETSEMLDETVEKCNAAKARDLVRRAKKLAERGE